MKLVLDKKNSFHYRIKEYFGFHQHDEVNEKCLQRT